MQIFLDLEVLSHAASEAFVRIAHQAIADHGRFDVALSGGSTPKRMFEFLATPDFQVRIHWSQVHVFWSDERYVPPTDPQSNERMARLALLDHIPIPSANIHGMYQPGRVETAAASYEDLIRRELGEDLSLDLTLLGVGPDGHTASLFPGEPAVHETKRMVVAGIGHAGIAERITMTPPLINRSRTVMFLVAGADKREPLSRIFDGPEDWDVTPSQAIARHAPNLVWMLDSAAAGEQNS